MIWDYLIVFIQVLPFTAQNVKLRRNLVVGKREIYIGDLYIPRKYKNTETGELVSSEEDLFLGGRRAILAKAPAGMGKTTLYRYILHKWGRGDILQQFEAVINFSCR